jgi:methyl-accepting chemotaxis protein
MHGKSALFLIVVLLICLSTSVLFINIVTEQETKIFATIITIVLSVFAFIVLYFSLIKKNASLMQANDRGKIALREKDDAVSSLQSELAALHNKDLHLYSRFGDYSLFTQELRNFNDRIDNLCTLLSSLKGPTDSINIDQIPAYTKIETLLKETTLISENIRKAFDIADNLSNSAKAAFEVSEKVQKGVKLVTSALEDTLRCATVLFEQSQQISGILELLSEISSKINILSINASIVSARAGIHGKPFKVVAKEIRKLASETEKSLKQIAEDIHNIKQVIHDVVGKIKYASEQTDAEKNALISVVGSLQGITLGVEVFRAVSKVARDKSAGQLESITSLSQNWAQYAEAFSKLSFIKENLEQILKTKEDVNEKNVLLKTRWEQSDSDGGGRP